MMIRIVQQGRFVTRNCNLLQNSILYKDTISKDINNNIKYFSSRKSSNSGKIEISQYGVIFGVFLVPAILCTIYVARYGPTSEQRDEQIKERYSKDINISRENNKGLANLYQNAILGKGDDQENINKKLHDVLHGGKYDKKRLYSVDEKLYGTKEGVDEKIKTVNEIENEKLDKIKKKKEKNDLTNDIVVEDESVSSITNIKEKKNDKLTKQQNNTSENLIQVVDESKNDSNKITTGQIVTVAAIGTIAAIAGLASGGGSR